MTEFEKDPLGSVDLVHEGEQGPEQGVKRRRAEDVLPLPGGDDSKWTPKKKEIKSLQKYEYRQVNLSRRGHVDSSESQ